jgi:hypothetical protein
MVQSQKVRAGFKKSMQKPQKQDHATAKFAKPETSGRLCPTKPLGVINR